MHTCYEKRRSLPGGAAREKLDDHLVKNLGELAALGAREVQKTASEAPPRRVAIALALAIHSHAHLTIFFANPPAESTEKLDAKSIPKPDFPIVLDPVLVRDTLGLQDWEVDDLREEVDRRVGVVLKQQRALDWLWGHFGLPDASPEPLFRVLFPGAHHAIGRVGLARRGSQLYAIVDQSPPPPACSLYLGWRDGEKQTLDDLGPFGGRFVDVGLRNALARGIGASEEEIIDILDRMITIVPRDQAGRFLAHDNWRTRAIASICKVGDNYSEPIKLTRTLQPDEVDCTDWMVKDGDNAVRVRESRTAFDTLALTRIAAMAKNIYGEMFACLLERADHKDPTPTLDDLELFDVSGHFRRALQPLLNWASSPKTAAFHANRLGVETDKVEEALKAVHDTWSAQLDRGWCAPPRAGQPRSVAAVVTLHMVDTWSSLRRLQLVDADKRWDHRDLLMLTAGHLLAEAPVQRLWAEGLSDLGAPADEPFSTWFMGTWTRMLDGLDTDSETFSGPFTLEF